MPSLLQIILSALAALLAIGVASSLYRMAAAWHANRVELAALQGEGQPPLGWKGAAILMAAFIALLFWGLSSLPMPV